VLVERTPDAALLLSGLPRMDPGSTGQYDIQALAPARVSGRDTHVIEITPLDQLRYGYRVWIDDSSAMPLKTQLRDSHGGVLEQIVFTSLNLMTRIPNSELEPGVDARSYRWIRRDSEPEESGKLTVSWESSALPAGFHMTASARQMLPGGPVEHVVFSDGLASVSVFVEAGPDVGAPGTVREDVAAIGASSAFSTVVQGYRVTAVGEVPPETVRVIAQAIRNAGPPAAAAAAAEPALSQTPLFVPPARDTFDGGLALPLTPAPIVHSFGPAPAGPSASAAPGRR